MSGVTTARRGLPIAWSFSGCIIMSDSWSDQVVWSEVVGLDHVLQAKSPGSRGGWTNAYGSTSYIAICIWMASSSSGAVFGFEGAPKNVA